MNIFVAKLNYNTTEFDIREMFEQFGTVESVKIITDRDSGRSKGFGFVEMPDEEEGTAAINALNGTEVDEFTIVVKKAIPKEERSNNRRGGFNRGGGGGYNRGGGGGGGYRGGGGGGGYRDRNRNSNRDRYDNNRNKDW